MILPASIFLDFNLPNATTWFYFSFLLATALFFKFSRPFTIRNLDILTIFLFVPGLLLIMEGKREAAEPVPAEAVAAQTSIILSAAPNATAPPVTNVAKVAAVKTARPSHAGVKIWAGYLWLLCCAVYFIFRCLLDLILVRRPAISANLEFGGLVWMSVTLFLCLGAVAFVHDNNITSTRNAVLTKAEKKVSPVAEEAGHSSVPLVVVQNQVRASWVIVRIAAILCHLSVVLGLIFAGWRHFHDGASGMAAATLYLLLPYTGYFVGQLHHVLPMALLIWAIVFYRNSIATGILLGLAAGTMFFPALLIPIWLSFYRRRGAWRFVLSCLSASAVCLTIISLFLWLNNDFARTVAATLELPDWQPWAWSMPKYESFWSGFHWAYRMPVFILYMAFVITTAFWPNPKNLAHVIALSAATLLGLQLWYGDMGGVYLLWYLPLLLLMVFRPILSNRMPATQHEDHLKLQMVPKAVA